MHKKYSAKNNSKDTTLHLAANPRNATLTYDTLQLSEAWQLYLTASSV